MYSKTKEECVKDKSNNDVNNKEQVRRVTQRDALLQRGQKEHDLQGSLSSKAKARPATLFPTQRQNTHQTHSNNNQNYKSKRTAKKKSNEEDEDETAEG